MSLKRKRKNNLLFLFGFGLCLLPTLLGILFQNQTQNVISSFHQEENKTNERLLQQQWKQAHIYNQNLYHGLSNLPYQDMLDISSTHVMATIEIPSIDVNLPIYHGTSDDILNVGIGHFDFSSLPVGGRNSHCILTGHRGLPNAKLFTRLDELQKKDWIYIRVCKKKLIYQVEKCYVIEPEDILRISIEKNKDRLSLVTCTPYGINTKRLVVQAKRVYPKTRPHIRKSYSVREICFIVVPVLLFILFIKKVRK